MITAIDDNDVVKLTRLFNEPEGKKYLAKKGVPAELISQLELFGLSGIANLLTTIKFAKYYELTEDDIVLSVLTDSMELYDSRITEYQQQFGEFTSHDAAEAYATSLMGESTDNLLELTYQDKKRVHNLKYYTWVEQQGKTYAEIMDQWYEKDYWTGYQSQLDEIDEYINEFNDRVGLLKKYL
jgi:hypothetical protein